jgi:hypothetical protein
MHCLLQYDSEQWEKSLSGQMAWDFSLLLGVAEIFGFMDIAGSRFVTDVLEQIVIFKAQDVQDSLIL